MVNYQNGKVYKIVNSVNDTVYVGSTTVALRKRLYGHRADAKRSPSLFYDAMNEHGADNFTIVLIKLAPCNCKEELLAEEYEQLDIIMNDDIPVYNSIVGRKHSSQTIAKMRSSHLGLRFKRGCISLHSRGTAWRFSWIENGKRLEQTFSFKKWGGEWGAKRMAELWQRMTYPIVK